MRQKYFSFTPFIDSLFCCLLMLVAILFLLKTEDKEEKMVQPNTIYQVILTWPGDSEDDLDLYVKASTGHVVSFGNREGGEGSLVSLNHDALGRSRNNTAAGNNGTVTNFNEEVVSFRGIFQGENVVNVHVYLKKDKEPVKAKIKLVRIKPFQEVVVKEKEFTVNGEEKTIFRFETDKYGNILGINELPTILSKPL